MTNYSIKFSPIVVDYAEFFVFNITQRGLGIAGQTVN